MRSVDLFAEDTAHELVVGGLISRVLQEEDVAAELRIRSARGGHGRAISELKAYQRVVSKGGIERPDLVVVAIDANCKGPVAAKNEIAASVDGSAAGDVVIACPDPHIERWMFADPEVFGRVVGVAHQPGKRKCARDEYKNMLADVVRSAGHFPTLGGLEFAQEVIGDMDIHRASVNEPSLGALVDGVRSFARRIKSAGK